MLFFSLFSRDPDLVTLPAGKHLFREGDEGDFMYVLVTGAADVSVRGKVVEHAVQGAIFGELAVLERSKRTATVTATTDSTLAKINEKRFHYLVSQTPYFATEVMRVMAMRLKQVDTML